MTKLRDIKRAVTSYDWAVANVLIRDTIYGLTNRRCTECAKYKGLSVDPQCYKCRGNQVIRHLFG